jgi:hypothetical protein
MKKIISLFQRNYDGDRLVRNEIVPGAEWVVAGEGIATRKYDGTCCMVKDGKLFKRYDVKKGKTPPKDFIPAQDPDSVTGHWPGWLPVTESPEDKYHREAFVRMNTESTCGVKDGTYELCGPKVQGNTECFEGHCLIKHGIMTLMEVPKDFDGLRKYLSEHNIEGIVWHHPDGRMVKIKGKDFGIGRNRMEINHA